jgi:hypothetical protein
MKNRTQVEFVALSQDLITTSKVSIVVRRPIVLEMFPQLKDASAIENWNLFCIVSTTFAALSKVNLYFEDEAFCLSLYKFVFDKLNKYDQNYSGAFEDLQRFLLKVTQQKPYACDFDVLAVSAGTWILWNLTSKKPIEDEVKIANVLGQLFFLEYVDYYAQRPS